MRKILFILIASCFAFSAKAQVIAAINPPHEDPVYTTDVVDVLPEFKGGMKKFYARIKRIPYTFLDRMHKRDGLVTVIMLIEKDGRLSDLKVMHGFSELQDKEIMRVIRRLKQWKPGMQDGKPVRVIYSIPINFSLEKSS